MLTFDSARCKSHHDGWRPRRQVFEKLEDRSLLSAIPLALPSVDLMAAQPSVSGPYRPGTINLAYGINAIALPAGLSAGAGQTIAIVDAYNDPNIFKDVQLFNQTFNLPQFNVSGGPSFTQINQSGGSSLPTTDSGWAMEIALDVEWAHAVAPNANIVLVEAKSNSYSDLLKAVDTASSFPKVSVVSMSWGSNEFFGETSLDSHFSPTKHPGVTFIAASGDSGAPGLWPAFSPNVVAAGGTTLTTGATGAYTIETGWSGSGGGYSLFEAKPGYQAAVQTHSTRSIPDVSLNANPSTGYYVYDTVPYGGQAGWWRVGGTSAAAPEWAGLFALVNQLRGAGNAIKNAPSALYSLYASSPGDFHDITSGFNGYSAKAGYDLVTGLGSPVASQLIADLAQPATALASTLAARAGPTLATSRLLLIRAALSDPGVVSIDSSQSTTTTSSTDVSNTGTVSTDAVSPITTSQSTATLTTALATAANAVVTPTVLPPAFATPGLGGLGYSLPIDTISAVTIETISRWSDSGGGMSLLPEVKPVGTQGGGNSGTTGGATRPALPREQTTLLSPMPSALLDGRAVDAYLLESAMADSYVDGKPGDVRTTVSNRASVEDLAAVTAMILGFSRFGQVGSPDGGDHRARNWFAR